MDCEDINLTELVGILLFEDVKELNKSELMQVIASYKHLRYNCKSCSYEFENMLNNEIDDLNNDELLSFKNLSKNLLELNGDFYIHQEPQSLQ